MPTQVISLRIDTELLEYLKERAEREHRTLTNMITSILFEEKKNGSLEKRIRHNIGNVDIPDYLAEHYYDFMGEIGEAIEKAVNGESYPYKKDN